MRTILQNCRQYSRKAARTRARIMDGNEMNDASSDVHSDSSNIEDEFRHPSFLELEKSRLPPGFPPFHKKGKDDSDLRFLSCD